MYSSGAHYWNKDCYSKDYYDKVLKPVKKDNVYIIGEAFSKHQAWMEGALETAKDVYNRYFSIQKGGGKKFSMKEVKKHNSVKDGWLVINNNVYKVPEDWTMKHHPGGQIIKKYLGKDVTQIWNSIHGNSQFAKNKLKAFMIGKIKI